MSLSNTPTTISTPPLTKRYRSTPNHQSSHQNEEYESHHHSYSGMSGGHITTAMAANHLQSVSSILHSSPPSSPSIRPSMESLRMIPISSLAPAPYTSPLRRSSSSSSVNAPAANASPLRSVQQHQQQHPGASLPPNIPMTPIAGTASTLASSSSPLVAHHSSIATLFGTCCTRLSIAPSSPIYDNAWKLIERITEVASCTDTYHHHNELNHRGWIACAIFTCNQLMMMSNSLTATNSLSQTSSSSRSPLSLTLLFKASHVRLTDFCGHIVHFYHHFPHLPPPFVQRVTLYQRCLSSLATVFATYDHFFTTLIIPLVSSSYHSSSSSLSSSSRGASTPESKTKVNKKRRHDAIQMTPTTQSEPSRTESKTLSSSSSSTSIMVGTTLSTPAPSSTMTVEGHPAPAASAPVISLADYQTSLFGCGWLLFVNAKVALNMSSIDRHASSWLVLIRCVLHTMVLCLANSKSTADIALLSLCGGASSNASLSTDGVDHALLKEVTQMNVETFTAFIKQLVDDRILVCDDRHYHDIFSTTHIISNAASLGHQYDNVVGHTNTPNSSSSLEDHTGFWIDERVYLEDKSVQPSLRVPINPLLPYQPLISRTSAIPPTHRRLFPESGATVTPVSSSTGQSISPPTSTISTAPPTTPMSKPRTYAYSAFSPVVQSPMTMNHSSSNGSQLPTFSLEGVNWLHDHIRPLPEDGASPLLHQWFDECNPPVMLHDIHAKMIALVSSISFVPIDESKEDNEQQNDSDDEHDVISPHRRSLALKLYYALLERMVGAERQRNPNLSSWLSSISFHSSLLACCVEIVIHAYRVHHLRFPHVVQRFGLRHWEFLKVIESFMRHLVATPPSSSSSTTLASPPSSVLYHMRQVEYDCIDRWCWCAEDTLPSLLTQPVIRTYLDYRFNLTSSSTGSSSSLPVLATPERPSSQPQQQSPVPVRTAQAFAVELFYRKLLQLASDRLEYLCGSLRLNLSPSLMQLIWSLIRHILSHKWYMMVNRHMDVIILSSTYMVGYKLAHIGRIPFKTIIAEYITRWDQHTDIVIRRILLHDEPPKDNISGSEEQKEPPMKYGNIIAFYNGYFVDHIHDFVTAPEFLHALDVAQKTPNRISDRMVTTPSSINNSSSANTNTNILSSPYMPRRHHSPDQVSIIPPLPPSSSATAASIHSTTTTPTITRRGPYHSSSSSAPVAATSAASSPSLATPARTSTRTPITIRSLYSFGESPGRNLLAMNDMIHNRPTTTTITTTTTVGGSTAPASPLSSSSSPSSPSSSSSSHGHHHRSSARRLFTNPTVPSSSSVQ